MYDCRFIWGNHIKLIAIKTYICNWKMFFRIGSSCQLMASPKMFSPTKSAVEPFILSKLKQTTSPSRIYCLFYNRHFINQPFSPCHFINNKQAVAYIQRNIAALVGVVHQIAHGTFPTSVEINSNQLSISI